PFARIFGRVLVPVGGEPFGEVAGDVVVGGELALEAEGGEGDRVVVAAVEEAEEDDEGAAEDPEQQRRLQLAQDLAVEPAFLPAEADRQQRAAGEQEAVGGADRLGEEVAPEGEVGERPGGDQADADQERHRLQPAPHREQHRGDHRQAEEDPVDDEADDQLAGFLQHQARSPTLGTASSPSATSSVSSSMLASETARVCEKRTKRLT